MQVRLHVLQELQDAVLQDVEETFQGVELFIHQLDGDTQRHTELEYCNKGSTSQIHREDSLFWISIA